MKFLVCNVLQYPDGSALSGENIGLKHTLLVVFLP
jgi:hypothetical protein